MKNGVVAGVVGRDKPDVAIISIYTMKFMYVEMERENEEKRNHSPWGQVTSKKGSVGLKNGERG